MKHRTQNKQQHARRRQRRKDIDWVLSEGQPHHDQNHQSRNINCGLIHIAQGVVDGVEICRGAVVDQTPEEDVEAVVERVVR